MTTSIENGEHSKDRHPADTIAHARHALRRVGVWLYEASWCANGDWAYSTRVCDAAWPDDAAVGANGKGRTREMALASAYGEYLERLQNLFLEPFNTNYGLMPPLLELPDAVRCTVHELWRRSPVTLAHLLPEGAVARHPDLELTCLPFYDVTDDREVLLPRKLLNWSCSSNGMGAGNTPAEALVAGLCEVLERHASRRTYQERIVLPDIPLLDLDGTHAATQLRGLAAAGLRVLLRDASLGLGLPVVALVVVEPETTRFQVKFGAAPTLALAVERCATELLQGRPSTSDVPTFPAGWDADPAVGPEQFRRAYHGWRRDGSGPFPSSILTARGTSRHREHFAAPGTGNPTNLHALRRLVESLGHHVLVRDVSFLGFPAYRVYVPGLAEVHGRADVEQLELLTTAWDRTARTLLRLHTADPSELRILLRDVERYRSDPRFASIAILENISGVVLAPSSPFRRLFQTDYLLTLVSLRLGDHERAARHLGGYLRDLQRSSGGPLTANYLGCAWQWLNGLVAGMDQTELRTLVANSHGATLAAEVESDLGDPAAVFDAESLAACGDCTACPLRPDCRYEIWKRTATRIRDALAACPIDQSQLRGVFAAAAAQS